MRALFIAISCFFAAVAQQTIVQTVASDRRLSTLLAVLSSPAYAPVLAALSGPGPFTVFAPDNTAFAEANLDLAHVAFVTATLQNHVVAGNIPSSSLQEGVNIRSTLLTNPDYVNNGGSAAINIEKFEQRLRVYSGVPRRGANVIPSSAQRPEIVCSNGVIYVVSNVINVPPNVPVAARESGLTILVDAVVKAGLVDAVNNTRGITIFAPFDEAFLLADWESLPEATLRAVLTAHVVPAVAYSTSLSNNQRLTTLQGFTLTVVINAQGVFLANPAGTIIAQVRIPNIITKNGVIHAIDRVIVPTSSKSF